MQNSNFKFNAAPGTSPKSAFRPSTKQNKPINNLAVSFDFAKKPLTQNKSNLTFNANQKNLNKSTIFDSKSKQENAKLTPLVKNN
jgi:hypothetical protein